MFHAVRAFKQVFNETRLLIYQCFQIINNNNTINYTVFINEILTFYISIGVLLYFCKQKKTMFAIVSTI